MKKFAAALVIGIMVIFQAGTSLAGASSLEGLPEIEGVTGSMDEASRKDVVWTLGLGAGFVPDYQGSSDNEAVPFPFAKVYWRTGRYIELAGNKLRANLLANNSFELGPVLRYNAGRDDVDNNRVDRLRKIDESVELGGYAAYRFNQWMFALGAVTDVSDGHDGTLARLKVAYTYLIEGSRVRNVRFGAYTTYADSSYMDSFFSIDANNASRSGLRIFDAESGLLDLGVDVSVLYEISQEWHLIFAGNYARLLGDAADSPVVDDEGSENQLVLGVVATYTF
jgi:outer membrane protein